MYEDIFKLYADTVDGKILYALPGANVGMNAPTESSTPGVWKSVGISVTQNTQIILNGNFFETNSGIVCYQCIYNGTSGYIWSDELSNWSATPYNQNGIVGKTQNYLNELIEYNKSILEGNLLCARIINYCKTNGIALPAQCRNDLYNLQVRLMTRNEKIKTTGYVENTEESASPNFSGYNQTLVDFMNNPGIGFVLTTTAIIIIVGIVIAATATTAILIYQKLNAEAKADFNYSNDLTAQLVKFLPPETYKQLMAENEANAKKANDAINAASGSGILNTVKYIGIGLGAVWLYDKFINKNK